jgi:aryl-alcohol dehydrogenase-like predicted oxidoreductase
MTIVPRCRVTKPDASHSELEWKIIDVLTDFGNKRGGTPAQVALAWLSAQKPWVVPIPGTTKLAHLQENLWSSDFEFTPRRTRNLHCRDYGDSNHRRPVPDTTHKVTG